MQASSVFSLFAALAALVALAANSALRASGTAGLSTTHRIPFTREHVDIRMVFPSDPQALPTVMIRDGDRGLNHPTTNVVLVVAEQARLAIPAGFDLFGPEGSPLWILPQSQDPALVYLGFSNEGFSRDRFEGRLRLQLKEVRGPGQVFLWQADAEGTIDLRMNSKDGLDDLDRIEPLIGGHEHYNLGFTTAGLYELVFQAGAQPLGSGAFLTGDPVAVLFAVEPLPVVPPPPPLWTRWINTHWPSADPSGTELRPEADPDHDGEPNVAEFLSDTNPLDPSSRPRVAVRAGTGFAPSLVIELPVVTERLGEARVRVEGAPSPTGPWTPLPDVTPAEATLRWEDSFASPPATRFYRRTTTKL